MDEPMKVIRPSSFDRANFISRWFYSWIIPLYQIGNKRPLEFSDLYGCCHQDEPIIVTSRLEKAWHEQLKKPEPSFLKALTKTFAWEIGWNNLLMMIPDLVVRLSQPFMLEAIIRYLKQPITASPDDPGYVSSQYAQIMSALLVMSSFVLQITRHYGWFLCSKSGNNIRTAVTAMLYKKVLRMSKSSSQQAEMGQVINVIANDLTRFEDLSWNIHAIPLAPIMTALVIWFTYNLIQESCFVGLAVIVLLLPIQAIMGRLFTKYRRSTAFITDRRVRLMSEIISAMKLIKFYCWEEPFSRLTNTIRDAEINEIRKSYYLKGANAALFFIGTRVMLFATFVAYVSLGNKLRPELVYTVMTLYNSIRLPVTNRFPAAVGTVGESLVAVKRIQDILLVEEKCDSNVINSASYPAGSIRFCNYNGKWNKNLDHTSLTDVNLQIKPGQLVVIIGSVGSGKSCFLWSILGEIHSVTGLINLNGNTSYASQESWCFGGTIQQNILMVNSMQTDRYNTVIAACGLERDLTLLPQSDLTFVGEKGYTLSGGQKARISLARSIYHKAEYYLMDDPLSSVDPRVANHIFQKCFKEFLAGKTILLVTHQLQFIEQADLIIYMHESKVAASGTYNDLVKNSGAFRDFIDAKKREKEETDRKKLDAQIVNPLASQLDKLCLQDTSSDRTESICSTKFDLEPHQFSRDETSEVGSLGFDVYWRYFHSGNSLLLLSLALVVTLISQGLNHFIDLWMAAWTTKEADIGQDVSTVSLSLIFDNDNNNVAVYSALVIALFILAFVRSTLIFFLCLRCSIKLHDSIFTRVLSAPMIFFENNPLGRILNRFTKDIGSVDQTLPSTLSELNLTMFQVIGTVITTIAVSWYMSLPCLIIAAFSIPIREYHLRTARQLQRLDSISRSPVFSHISETFVGLTTVRSFNLQDQMLQQYIRYLRDSVSTRFLVMTSGRIIGITLDTFACFFMMSICILLMQSPRGMISSGDAGVLLSNSILLIGMYQWCVRLSVDVESQFVSVERVLEYGRLTSEGSPTISAVDNQLPVNWPRSGAISFNRVCLRYSPDLPLVLKDVSFEIQAKEKIGIVGRTGAGKSSLITVLFRMAEIESGHITIDSVDIASLGLHKLRKHISIIPQDPSLFSGSIRKNLDPFDEHDDEQLWKALGEASLQHLVQSIPGELEGSLTEGGTNLSVGQRQLLCLARALLRQNSILVLDEATANVDQETDEQIKVSIKKNFSNCTILAIAHRLNTIIDMDKVLVMGAGQVLEFDEPYKLLQNPDGFFYNMIKQTGPFNAAQLHYLAKEAHSKRNPNEKREDLPPSSPLKED